MDSKSLKAYSDKLEGILTNAYTPWRIFMREETLCCLLPLKNGKFRGFGYRVAADGVNAYIDITHVDNKVFDVMLFYENPEAKIEHTTCLATTDIDKLIDVLRGMAERAIIDGAYKKESIRRGYK